MAIAWRINFSGVQRQMQGDLTKLLIQVRHDGGLKQGDICGIVINGQILYIQ